MVSAQMYVLLAESSSLHKFTNYDESCVNTRNCQLHLTSTDANTNLLFGTLYTIGSWR
jgi:hypothetical protein